MNNSIFKSTIVIVALCTHTAFGADCEVTKISPDVDQIKLPQTTVLAMFNEDPDQKYIEAFLNCIHIKSNPGNVSNCFQKVTAAPNVKYDAKVRQQSVTELTKIVGEKNVEWVGVEAPENTAPENLVNKQSVAQYQRTKGMFQNFVADEAKRNEMLSLLFNPEVVLFGENSKLDTQVKSVPLENSDLVEKFHASLIGVSVQFDKLKKSAGFKEFIFRHDYHVIEQAMTDAYKSGQIISKEKIEKLSMHFVTKVNRETVVELFKAVNVSLELFTQRNQAMVKKLRAQKGVGLVSMNSAHRDGLLAGLKQTCETRKFGDDKAPAQ